MRRSAATREPLWRSQSARETDVKEARSRFEALRKGASTPPVHLLTARRELVHAHGHAAASTTRGTDSAACCSPSRSRRRLPAAAAPRGCSRRRLPPPLAPRASCAAGSRGCSRPTAALAVGLRRGHALLGSPRVAAPRASAAAAAQGCSRRRLPLPLASCAAGTRA